MVGVDRDRLQRIAGIRDWYKATVCNLEQLGGVRISVRGLSGLVTGGEQRGGADGRHEQGLELMVDLGFGQVSCFFGKGGWTEGS